MKNASQGERTRHAKRRRNSLKRQENRRRVSLGLRPVHRSHRPGRWRRGAGVVLQQAPTTDVRVSYLLENYGKPELVDLARGLKVKGRSKLNKSDLAQAIAQVEMDLIQKAKNG